MVTLGDMHGMTSSALVATLVSHGGIVLLAHSRRRLV
jgi:hypothetical protein